MSFESKPRVFHQTDLFHPHQDPDDHWDLACQFALAKLGHIELVDVLIDNPDYTCNWEGLMDIKRSPDNNAVAQLSYLTSVSPRVSIGTSVPLEGVDDQLKNAPCYELNGVEAIARTLRESDAPTAIHIVGSCRDIAVAGNRYPELFREKCSGIYLNAGASDQDNPNEEDLEFNTTLNAAGYAATFSIPCPIYWMPCFGVLEHNDQIRKVEAFSTHWNFKHQEILRYLPQTLQNYFNYMYLQRCDSDWLRYLHGEVDEAVLLRMDSVFRSMWCTAGFLHAAGMRVDREGNTFRESDSLKASVFEFVPCRIHCSEKGITKWSLHEPLDNQFIFQVQDVEAYRSAMLNAMTRLLVDGFSQSIQQSKNLREVNTFS